MRVVPIHTYSQFCTDDFFFFFSITCILIGTKEKVDLPTVELSHLFLINLNFKSFHFSVRIFLYLPTSFSTICFDVSFAFHPTSSLIKIILFTLVTFLLPLYCCYAQHYPELKVSYICILPTSKVSANPADALCAKPIYSSCLSSTFLKSSFLL